MKFIRLATVLAGLAAPAFASAAFSLYTNSNGQFGFSLSSGSSVACTSSNICQVAQTLLYLINFVAVPVIFAFAFIVFIWGVFKAYIWSHGEPDEVSEGHRLILWGVLGFVVMVSLWGLVNVVANTFGLTGYVAPLPPTSGGIIY